MKLQKWLSLWLALVLCLTLAACGGEVATPQGGDSTTTTTGTTSTSTTTQEGLPPTSGGGSSSDGTSTTSGTSSTSTTSGTSSTTATTTGSTASAADKATVDAAFQLGKGEKIENVTLTGVVTDSQGYSAGYNNATFDLQVEGGDGVKTIYCYRVKPADAARTEVGIGDVVTLSGTIQNYKGTIEFYPATYTIQSAAPTTTTTRRPVDGDATIDEDGVYESKEDVALYLHVYGKLPKNFVTKSEWKSLGKPSDKCCGGDRFYNNEGQLPNKAGRLYYECDIDSLGLKKRNAKRIVYSNDGLIYYTGDHYATFTLLYGEP